MIGFQYLFVWLKILFVVGLGIFLFFVYFLYSYYIVEINIDYLCQVESYDFLVLELVNVNNVEFLVISDVFDDVIIQVDVGLLDEVCECFDCFFECFGDIECFDFMLSVLVDDLCFVFIIYIIVVNDIVGCLVDDFGVWVSSYEVFIEMQWLEQCYIDEYSVFE